MTSSDDAFLLLRKWKIEKLQIQAVFVLDLANGSFAGIVTDVDEPSLSVRIVGLDSRSQFTFHLRNLELRYADSREAPEALKHEAHKYEGCLTALDTGSGDRISFFEIRDNI